MSELGDGALDALFRAGPLLAAEAGEAGGVVARSDVAADPVHLVGRHVDLVALGVAQFQVLALDAADSALDEACEAGDAVFDVDDVVAGREVGEERLASGPAFARQPAALFDEPEDFGVGEERERRVGGGEPPTMRERAVDDADGTGRGGRGLRGEGGRDAFLGQYFSRALGLLGDDDQCAAASGRLGGVGGESAEPAAVGIRLGERKAGRGGIVGGGWLLGGGVGPAIDGPAREVELPVVGVEQGAELLLWSMGKREARGQFVARLEVLTHLLGLCVVLFQCVGDVHGFVEDEQAGGGQVLEHVSRRQEWQVEALFGERISGRKAGELLFEPLAHLGGAAAQIELLRERRGRGGQVDQLAGGADSGGLKQLLGALGIDVEAAKALDAVTEEFDSQRGVFGRGEAIDDASAAGDVTGQLHERLRLIAEGEK